MSQEKYTAIQKMRLIDLGNLPVDDLLAWLADKPDWLKRAMRKAVKK